MHRWILTLVIIVLLGLAALGFVKRKVAREVAKRLAPVTQGEKGSSAGGITSFAHPGAPAVSALKPIGFGLTFAVVNNPSLATDTVSLSCQGEPAQVDRPFKDACNPYEGDTSCRTVLPILCANAGELDAPAGADPSHYQGWVHGSLGATEPVMEAVLESAAAASAVCEKELGPGWRMAEFVEGSGGWGMQGQRGLGLTGNNRYWVHAQGKNANCWNSSP